jgi:hypothetical protein
MRSRAYFVLLLLERAQQASSAEACVLVEAPGQPQRIGRFGKTGILGRRPATRKQQATAAGSTS